jgi:hypothetical protein
VFRTATGTRNSRILQHFIGTFLVTAAGAAEIGGRRGGDPFRDRPTFRRVRLPRSGTMHGDSSRTIVFAAYFVEFARLPVGHDDALT